MSVSCGERVLCLLACTGRQNNCTWELEARQCRYERCCWNRGKLTIRARPAKPAKCGTDATKGKGQTGAYVKGAMPVNAGIHQTFYCILLYVSVIFEKTSEHNIMLRLFSALRTKWLTLPVLRLLSPKAQGCKYFAKTPKSWHVGIHWIALD